MPHLTPGHVRGTLSVFRPAWAFLSPAYGLALSQQCLSGNWFSFASVCPTATGALLRELFHQITLEAPLRCTAAPGDQVRERQKEMVGLALFSANLPFLSSTPDL